MSSPRALHIFFISYPPTVFNLPDWPFRVADWHPVADLGEAGGHGGGNSGSPVLKGARGGFGRKAKKFGRGMWNETIYPPLLLPKPSIPTPLSPARASRGGRHPGLPNTAPERPARRQGRGDRDWPDGRSEASRTASQAPDSSRKSSGRDRDAAASVARTDLEEPPFHS